MTLPSGPLREPLSSLKDSQIVVINGKVNKFFEKKIKTISNNINIYYSDYLPNNINQFRESLEACLIIGIIYLLLEKNNLHIAKKISYPDHYNYSIKELNNLVNFSIWSTISYFNY